MQLLKEVLNTEAEFKAACIGYGDQVLPILNYLLTTKKEGLYNGAIKEDSKKIIELKKISNLMEIITEIENSRYETAPQFNV